MPKTERAMFKRINVSQAKELLLSRMTILVDIRDHDSYEEGHVPASVHLTQETLPVFVSGTNKDVPVMVMCYHGNSSQMIAQLLTEQGFREVYSIDGGYEAWADGGNM